NSFQQTGVGDVTPPHLASFSLSPTSVDTSSGPATITFTARITDDVSGFDLGVVQLQGPSGQFINVNFNASSRISGSALDGTYDIAATLPRFAEQGTWLVDIAVLRDAALNNGPLDPPDLAAAGFPNSFQQTGV